MRKPRSSSSRLLRARVGTALGIELAELLALTDTRLRGGTYLPISPDEAFLWTQGSVKGVHMSDQTRDVYKEGTLKPVPSPLLVRRFSGSGGWFETCAGIIGLTKMDGNNNTLYEKLPVKLDYSQRFARIIQQNPNLVDAEFDFRNFM